MLRKCILCAFGLLMVLPTSFSVPVRTEYITIEASVPIARPGFNHHRSPLRQVRSAKIDTYLNGKRVHLKQANAGQTYEHSIDGAWDYAVGEVGFFYNFPKTGKAFISIIGLKTEPNGDGVYATEPWDRKAFFFDVGDGVPMHLSAEYYDEYVDEDDPNLTVKVFYCSNLLYRQKGKDYSDSEYDGEWIDFELLTDSDNNVLDYNILTLDANDETGEVRKFEIGDEVESWTSVFMLDDPDTIWLTSMEEDFRIIQSAPEFMYTHLTPNVDFPNAVTEGKINFPSIDLNLILLGVNEAENAETPFQFSAPKRMKLQWDGTVSSGVLDWAYSLLK
ncbi:hypothetical protein K8I31_11215 [bacterium]|nr:hypothetical protein [bacterium]